MPDHPVEALLSRTTFTPIHRDWLTVRERCLAERLQRRKFDGVRSVLLVNATLGPTFYPSILDFFATLQRIHPQIRVTSSSYFDEIYELARDVPRRGLAVVPISGVTSWDASDLARFDLIIAIGPSEAFARLMTIEGLRPRLVLLDLGFYHQMIAATEGRFLSDAGGDARSSDQRNEAACYSCQPQEKITQDLSRYFAVSRFRWRWLPYIPLGFSRREYYRSGHSLFDVALLGAGGRDYPLLRPGLLRGLRFLFIGSIEHAPHIERLRSELDLTVVSRADEDDYTRLLSTCRCVVLPMIDGAQNVLLSAADALASGVPLIASRQPGFERLEREHAPIVFFENRSLIPMPLSSRRAMTSAVLAHAIRTLVRARRRRQAMSERAVAFARERLDIYGMLETIIDEQLA